MKPKMNNKSINETLGVKSTSPITLTPTTFKSLSTFLEDNNTVVEDISYSTAPEVVSETQSAFPNLDAKKWTSGGTMTVLTPTSMVPATICDRFKEEMEDDEEEELEEEPKPKRPKRKVNPNRRVGGRRPNNLNKNGEELSPEEEERVRIRRERNKLAAARCRKRRVDQTNDLLEMVQEEEVTKRALQDEIQALENERKELEFVLNGHRFNCRLNQQQPSDVVTSSTRTSSPSVVVKSEPVIVEAVDDGTNFIFQTTSKPSRPVSLSLNTTLACTSTTTSCSQNNNLNVTIETPSVNIPSLTFDSIFEGTSTGLTPIANMITPMFPPTLQTPTCSSQHQRTAEELSSNDSGSPNLVSL